MKKRLDAILFENNYYPSREKAKSNIILGNVFVEGQKITKPGTNIDVDAKIEIKDNRTEFVSRGGYKLKKAILAFNIDISNMVALDIGASTGGFTDCLLKNGAKKVYAVDVGYGQIDWSLRNDERVILMERQNARYLTEQMFDEKFDIATMDTSFISLTLLIGVVYKLLKRKGKLVALIKPQFEAGKDEVGKKGIIKDPKIHIKVINKVVDFAKGVGFYVVGIEYSPIKGQNGNIEYLIYLSKEQNLSGEDVDIENLVFKAHQNL